MMQIWTPPKKILDQLLLMGIPNFIMGKKKDHISGLLPTAGYN